MLYVCIKHRQQYFQKSLQQREENIHEELEHSSSRRYSGELTMFLLFPRQANAAILSAASFSVEGRAPPPLLPGSIPQASNSFSMLTIHPSQSSRTTHCEHHRGQLSAISAGEGCCFLIVAAPSDVIQDSYTPTLYVQRQKCLPLPPSLRRTSLSSASSSSALVGFYPAEPINCRRWCRWLLNSIFSYPPC